MHNEYLIWGGINRKSGKLASRTFASFRSDARKKVSNPKNYKFIKFTLIPYEENKNGQ